MNSGSRRLKLTPGYGVLEFVTCLWIVCSILTLVVSEHQNYYPRYGKRLDPEADSFFVSGGRYGRSGTAEKSMKSLPKMVEVMPRVDRFYSGSRYGKRVPPHYKRPLSIDRFNAVLDYMDRENELDAELENPGTKDADDLRVLS